MSGKHDDVEKCVLLFWPFHLLYISSHLSSSKCNLCLNAFDSPRFGHIIVGLRAASGRTRNGVIFQGNQEYNSHLGYSHNVPQIATQLQQFSGRWSEIQAIFCNIVQETGAKLQNTAQISRNVTWFARNLSLIVTFLGLA